MRMTVVQCVWSSKEHQDGGCMLLLGHRLNSPVPGHRRDSVHSAQDPTASFLVPFCTLTFDVTVPALLAHPLKQMFSASARSVCDRHSSAGRLLSKSFQRWKGVGSITTTISINTNLFGNCWLKTYLSCWWRREDLLMRELLGFWTTGWCFWSIAIWDIAIYCFFPLVIRLYDISCNPLWVFCCLRDNGVVC